HSRKSTAPSLSTGRQAASHVYFTATRGPDGRPLRDSRVEVESRCIGRYTTQRQAGYAKIAPMPHDNRLQQHSLAAQVAALPPAWRAALQDPPVARALENVTAYVEDRLAQGAIVYPATPFRALEGLAPSDVRVVILGQDPYHGAG